MDTLPLKRVHSVYRATVSKSLMNLGKNNQNTAILRIIRISKICNGSFTANYQKILSSCSNHSKI